MTMRSGQHGQLRVPRVTQEFFPVMSGPANQALAIARGLERRGVASPVFTTTAGSDPRTVDITVLRFPALLRLPNFRVAPGLGPRLLREPADLLHVHGWRNPASDTAIRAARRRRLPLVVQAHGIAFGHQYATEPGLVRAARGAADTLIRPTVVRETAVVVAGTRLEAEELRRYGFPSERIVVIPAGVDAQFFASVTRPKRERITLLAVGRLGPRRNLEQLILALARLRAIGADADLRIVGPEVSLALGETAGYRARLETLARECGVASAVEFAGERRGAALVAEYHTADIFVCMSRYENFGQPRAEAAAAGLPVVATPTGIAPDLIGDGSAGVLAPADDPDALAAALLPLCERPELRCSIGLAARRRAAELFDWEQIVPRYLDLYRSLCNLEPTTSATTHPQGASRC